MRPLAVLAAMLVAMLALPVGAQNNTTGGNSTTKNVTSCPDTGNNVNQAQNAQNCPDGSQNPKARTTSKGGNSGQQRHPGVNR